MNTAALDATAPDATAPDAIGAKEVARMFNVCYRTVFRWTKSGALPKPARIGGTFRWPRSVIEDMLNGPPSATA